MADGRIKELIDKYEKLRAEKDELAEKTKENNEAYKQVQIDLAEAISDADMADAQDGDYVYTPGVTTKYSFKSMADLEEAITRVIAGPKKTSRVMSDKEKRLTAYHEAGHAIVMRSILRSADWSRRTSTGEVSTRRSRNSQTPKRECRRKSWRY